VNAWRYRRDYQARDFAFFVADFVIEALSVILQVGSFKLRGKRIFRMAPIHHHLSCWVGANRK